MEMRGMMGGFYKISEWIMRLAVTNVLWVLTSIPVFFLLVLPILKPPTPDAAVITFQQILLPLCILLPFTWFPSTSAMFSVARKWVMGDTDAPLLKTFFRSYKQNYLQAMLGGILYSVLFVILAVDYQVYLKKLTNYGVLSILFLALMVLLFISLFQFFSLLAHFHMKTFGLLKNAVVLTIGRPLRSLSTAIVSAFIVFMSMRFLFLVPFFMGSIIALFAFYNFYLTIQKMQSAASTDEDQLQIEDSPTKDEQPSGS